MFSEQNVVGSTLIIELFSKETARRGEEQSRKLAALNTSQVHMQQIVYCDGKKHSMYGIPMVC